MNLRNAAATLGSTAPGESAYRYKSTKASRDRYHRRHDLRQAPECSFLDDSPTPSSEFSDESEGNFSFPDDRCNMDEYQAEDDRKPAAVQRLASTYGGYARGRTSAQEDRLHGRKVQGDLHSTPDASESTGATIEVSPGQHFRLRGADETWRAVEYDFFQPCECMSCASTIFCIQDADFVLCPECRVVSPLSHAECSGDGGVGLGFSMQDLAMSQQAIVSRKSS